MKFFTANTLLLGLLLVPAVVVVNANQVGDSVCVEGFIMDFFCIERGTLFDNPSVPTLENPAVHSYHCLLDVPQCIRTDYEILVDPPEGQTTYCRGFRLDADSKERVLAAARNEGEQGFCTTCTGVAGSPNRGYRATIFGTIVEEATNSTPAIISATRVLSQTDESDEYGCPEGLTLPTTCIIEGVGSLTNTIHMHGSLMILGWGFFLPIGIITARLFRHRPNGLWFKLHRVFQTVGLVLALAGFAIALKNFEVFGKEARGKGIASYIHGCLGVTVMTIGLTQPLNALIRPHAPEHPTDEKNMLRVAWEFWHKGLGYAALILSVATISYGTKLLATKEEQKNFRIGYGVCIIMWFLMSIAMIYDKQTFNAAGKMASASDEKNADDDKSSDKDDGAEEEA